MTTLRADAPAFVPFFSTHESVQDVINETQDGFENSERKKSRNARRKSKTGADHQFETSESVRPRRKKEKGRRKDGKRRKSVDGNISGVDDQNKESQRQKNKDRIRRRGKQGSHRHDRNDATTSDAQEALESNFPPLSADDRWDCQHYTPVQGSSEWAQVARNADLQADLEAKEMKRREKQADVHDSSSGVILTALGRGKNTGVSNQAAESPAPPPNESVSDSEKSDTELDQPAICARFSSARDMTKLRDRWWSLVKIKQRRDAEEASKRQQELEAESSDSSTSYAESLVLTSCHYDNDTVSLEEDQDESNDYSGSPHPLHMAVIKDDTQAVRKLLLTGNHAASRTSLRSLGLGGRSVRAADQRSLSPLQLAVLLDKPEMVRVMLDAFPSLVREKDHCNRTSLMLAAELGLESCAKLLTGFGFSPLDKTKDCMGGDMALHYACESGTSVSMVQFLLSYLKEGSSEHQKIIFGRNSTGQTPLHVACAHGHVNIVDLLLTLSSRARLSKLLRLTDDDGLTPLLSAISADAVDVATSLLMWRGNHQTSQRTTRRAEEQEEQQAICPLQLAVSRGSLEMVQLLLEFTDSTQTAKGFDLDRALIVAVQSSHDSRHDIIRLLVNSGASPAVPLTCDNSCLESTTTALSMATCQGDAVVLRLMVTASKRYLASTQDRRRRDPKLRKQPRSYFNAIEAKEKHILDVASRDAVVLALYESWEDPEMSPDILQSVVVLFQEGTKPRRSDLTRLKDSIQAGCIQPHQDGSSNIRDFCFASTYQHSYPSGFLGGKAQVSDYDRSLLSFWSILLMQMPWMLTSGKSFCPWINCSLDLGSRDLDSHLQALLKDDRVILVAGATRFVVHGTIIARSDKLAAAVRFERMSMTKDDAMPILETDLSPKHAMYFLQHCYHGSLVHSLSSAKAEFAADLLHLALIADEYLCPSLVKECQMRLLSSDPTCCFCWSCCSAIRFAECTSESLQGATVDCLFHVHGPSSLLSANNALDALAVCEQLSSDAEPRLKYRQRTGECFHHSWESHDTNENALSDSLACVKGAAIDVILRQFMSVIESSSYKMQLNGGEEKSRLPKELMETHIMLLRMCVDEITDSSFVEAAFAPQRRLRSTLPRRSMKSDSSKAE